MKKIRICTPVTGKNLTDFLANLQSIQKISKLIELRVDYLSDLKIEDLAKIRACTKKTAIFTCRAGDQGGKFVGGEDKRLAILEKAFSLGFDFVDVELTAIEKLKITDGMRGRLILSDHNFQETPDFWALNKLVFEMNRQRPAIIKIATMVRDDFENVKLYRLMVNKPHKENRIIVGMGEAGRMSRILGPLLGSYLTYAATDYGQTAPGQIKLEELKKIYQLIS